MQGDNKFHVWNYKGHQGLIESCGCKCGMNAHKFVKSNKFHVWNYKGYQGLIESCGCKRGMNAHKFVKSNEWLSKKIARSFQVILGIKKFTVTIMGSN